MYDQVEIENSIFKSVADLGCPLVYHLHIGDYRPQTITGSQSSDQKHLYKDIFKDFIQDIPSTTITRRRITTRCYNQNISV